MKFDYTRPYSTAPIKHTPYTIERLDYALSDHATMSFFNLAPKNKGSTSDVGGAMLVNRTYRVSGVIEITVQNGSDYWSGSL